MFRFLSDTWIDFWYLPVRAERLGLMRIALGLCLLVDQLLNFLPYLGDIFGPAGISPAGLRTQIHLDNGRWTPLFFSTDHLPTVYTFFALWMLATLLFTLGLFTRLANIAVWVLTLAFFGRCRFLLNGGNDMALVGLFLLMWAPSGATLSLDRRWGRGSDFIPPWSVRLIQIQLAMIYFSTGLLKLQGYPGVFEGTWWEGTSVHYTLNFIDRSRWAYAQFPIPLWITATLTYLSLGWEVFFPVLVLHRYTRWPTLIFGILFHLGILLTIEIGMFSLYSLSFYAVWIPFTRRGKEMGAAQGTSG